MGIFFLSFVCIVYLGSYGLFILPIIFFIDIKFIIPSKPTKEFKKELIDLGNVGLLFLRLLAVIFCVVISSLSFSIYSAFCNGNDVFFIVVHAFVYIYLCVRDFKRLDLAQLISYLIVLVIPCSYFLLDFFSKYT